MDVLDLPTVDKLVLEYHFPEHRLQPRTAPIWRRHRRDQCTRSLKITPTMPRRGRVLLNIGRRRSPGKPMARRQLHGERAGLLKIEPEGPHAEGERLTAIHDRRVVDVGPTCTSINLAATRRRARSKNLRRSARRRRLRRQAAADVLFGERWRGENGESLRRFETYPKSPPRTRLPRRDGPQGRRLCLLLREGVRQRRRRGGKTTTSDIYFVQIKPFRKDYKQAHHGGRGAAAVGANRLVSCRSSSADRRGDVHAVRDK